MYAPALLSFLSFQLAAAQRNWFPVVVPVSASSWHLFQRATFPLVSDLEHVRRRFTRYLIYTRDILLNISRTSHLFVHNVINGP